GNSGARERGGARNRERRAAPRSRRRADGTRTGGGARPRRRTREGRLNGLPAAPGFGRGRAHILQPPVSFAAIDERRAEDVAAERMRFQRALTESIRELEALKVRLARRLPEFDGAII